MVRATVVFHAAAVGDIEAIHAYIAAAAGLDIALRFTTDLVAYCQSLSQFPERGRLRADIRPQLRCIGYRRRAMIAYLFQDKSVVILRILYRGQTFAADAVPNP